MATFHGLLLRFSGGNATRIAAASSLALNSAGAAFELEPLFQTGTPRALGFAGGAADGRQWYLARPKRAPDGSTEWDVAHETYRQIASGVGFAGGAVPDLIEPDLLQQWITEGPRPDVLGAAETQACVFDDQNPQWPDQRGVFAWHLGDRFSQLRAARELARQLGDGATVRIVHLDTGYDPDHATFPAGQADLALGWNFVENNNDARDPGNVGLLRNPGHGTGTLSILAGGRFTFSGGGYQFDEVLGGAPDARIVPVRVGNSVVQIRTSSVARGIAHAVKLSRQGDRVDVISMSMGGVASGAWADAVNDAYEAGIVFVAAAGNNLRGLPTRFIVYPARFRRVIAACGVMADHRPYWDLGDEMQGNWGPRNKMGTAVSAFTPNAPWARWGCPQIVRMNGEGTSSATPQVAAAAALYMQAHAAELFKPGSYARPWMRVEAVRHALFEAAEKAANGEVSDQLGQGVIRADDAIRIAPPRAQFLTKAKEDSAFLSFLNVLLGTGITTSSYDRMLQIEATQLAQGGPEGADAKAFEEAMPDPDREDVSREEVHRFLSIVADHPKASKRLKDRARDIVVNTNRTGWTHDQPAEAAQDPTGHQDAADKAGMKDDSAVLTEAPPAPAARGFTPPEPPFRKLRGYALDPSLQLALNTVDIGEVVFDVPWEKLEPGPVGEYIEVVDIDPASECFYEPIDLDTPALLAQNGLPPSEGTPQFHQQMVYAVASLTIDNFEHALGRRILWRPGPARADNPYDDAQYVGKLRIYPHALREANAYYSPDKVALLFGYFDATPDDPGNHLPGGRVFTCLSHDIIAHETTHALLDGIHRRFLLPSNPDVRAFHEAFADCVALFQHFTFPEILRHQIASTRGNLRENRNLLGELATQFGHATGARQALRDAIGKFNKVTNTWEPHKPVPGEFERTTTPHERGAILVAAIFDAFLSIYERRTADLLRLATGGSGVLQPGAIHPDLVNRLAGEAAKSAQHVLTMCIRALDYCPPTDITFGEFLRAVITADHDLVRNDDLNYRVSFIEAFRRRGIYPREIRTLSVESLLWFDPQHANPTPSPGLALSLKDLRETASIHGYSDSREKIFSRQRDVRIGLHDWLEQHFATSDGPSDALALGLNPKKSFEVHMARFVNRVSPDGGFAPQLVVSVLQHTTEPIDPDAPNGPRMLFEGGSTIIADLRKLKINYCIRKNINSTQRLATQQRFALKEFDSSSNTYVASRPLSPEYQGHACAREPFALIHRGH